MKDSVILAFSLLSLLWLHRGVASKGSHKVQAATPPRGWNSYDSFSWTISEEEFLQNAELVSKRLHSHGYEYVVVDYLWYRRKVPGATEKSGGYDVIDEWGRMVPDPDRWPSSRGGKGFSEVARKVHSMGLKFGIHVMRGISTQAVNANTTVLDSTKGGAYVEGGRKWTARDIGNTERRCAWMPEGFMAVNTALGAGRAFLRSLYEQYAEWGVDFVKHDCIFGNDLDIEEITYVSEVLRKLSRPILYSISPGTSVTAALAKVVSGLVNMYRITGDDWDNWRDVSSHFDISRDLAVANFTGASSLIGRSWPDLDMLPLGWLTDPGSNEGPHRKCNLTIEEQKTQVTLWAMAKSPLMLGGDMRNLDSTTFNLITNPTILEINSYSSHNKEVRELGTVGTVQAPAGTRSWVATGRRGEVYIAVFNLNQAKTQISAKILNLPKVLPGIKPRASYKCTEVWSGQPCRITRGSISMSVEPHGAALLVLVSKQNHKYHITS